MIQIPIYVRFSVHGNWQLERPFMDPTLTYTFSQVTEEERTEQGMPDDVATRIVFPDETERFSPMTEEAIQSQFQIALMCL